MTAGLTVRVDRFGQTQVVTSDVVFHRYFTNPPDPDRDGVYDITTAPTTEGATS